jgi:putative morphine 6-dehydrogenase
VLRWFLQQNIIMIPKTWETKHLKENISIFDFKLSEEEMTSIDTLNEGKFLNYIPLGEAVLVTKEVLEMAWF